MDQSKWCKIPAIRICHKRSKIGTNHKRSRRWDKKVDRGPIVMGLRSKEHSCFNAWIEEVNKRRWVGDPTSASQRIVLATDAPVAIRDGWPGWTEYTQNLPMITFSFQEQLASSSTPASLFQLAPRAEGQRWEGETKQLNLQTAGQLGSLEL